MGHSGESKGTESGIMQGLDPYCPALPTDLLVFYLICLGVKDYLLSVVL